MGICRNCSAAINDAFQFCDPMCHYGFKLRQIREFNKSYKRTL